MVVAKKFITLSIICLKAIDVITSYFLIDKLGSHVEANPITRHIIESIGLIPALSFSFILTSLIVLIAHKYNKIQALWVVAVILSVVCINNVLQFILFF